MTSQKVQEIVFTAPERLLLLCICMRERAHNRLKTDTLCTTQHEMTIRHLAAACWDSWKGSELSKITWVTHLSWVAPFKEMQSSVNCGLLAHCYLIIHAWAANKQFSCQPEKGHVSFNSVRVCFSKHACVGTLVVSVTVSNDEMCDNIIAEQ